MKDLEKEFVENGEMLKIVSEIKTLVKEDKYKNDAIKDLKEEYPDKFEKLEEALLKSVVEHDLRFWKTEFPDNK